ncbi:MAG: PH domain-containing protein, partial [Asgard group archaeon]|nr:PH domain-containing protein [Asgard group archaeon]
SIKQFNPAKEIKKKWYFWIVIIFLFAILCPIVILVSVYDFNFLNILHSSKAIFRTLANSGVLIAIIIVFFILTCLLLHFYYKTIKYEILDTEITITKGLFVKTKAVIPFRTITNLVIKQGPIEFILGISQIIIQTAGESAKAEPEGKIIGVYYAQDLIEEILNLVRLLDPPAYLREKIPISTTPKNLIQVYSQILDELQKIDEKLDR